MPRGRPKGSTTKPKTTHIRLTEDLAMIATEVAAHTHVSVPDLLDSILRAPLFERFRLILPAVKALAKTSDEARERLEEVLKAIADAEAMRKKAGP